MSVSVPCMLAHGNTRSSKNPNHPNRGSSSRSSSNNPNQKPIPKPKTKKKAGLKDNMSIEEYFALDENDDDDGMDDQTSIHTFVSCPTCMASHMVTKEFLLRDVDGMEDGRGKEKVQKTEQKLEQKQGKRLFCNACETHFIATVDMLEEI